jgi:hypothetical protein
LWFISLRPAAWRGVWRRPPQHYPEAARHQAFGDRLCRDFRRLRPLERPAAVICHARTGRDTGPLAMALALVAVTEHL